MRKITLCLLMFSLILSLTACGSSAPAGQKANGAAETSSAEAIAEPQAEPEAAADREAVTVTDAETQPAEDFSFDTHVNRIQANGTYTYGLTSAGTLVASSEPYIDGGNVVKTLPEYKSWTGIQNFSTSSEAVAAVLEDGTVVMCGGLVDEMQYSDFEPVSEWKNVVQVAMGKNYIAALMADGTVQIAGNYLAEYPSEEERFIQVEAGCAPIGLRADGTVKVWYWGWSDPIDDVTAWSDITAVSSSWNHIAALRSDGTVVASGNNDYGQCDVSGWTDIVAVSAGLEFTVGLKSDGTVVFCGNDKEGTLDFSSWSDIVEIDAGYYHCVGRRSDGKVVAAGQNYQGQLNTDGMVLN